MTSVKSLRPSSSPRVSRWLFRGTLLLGIGGMIAALVVWFANTGHPIKQTFSNQPPAVVKPEKNVAAPPEVEKIASRFILTAVRRNHLDEAWKLVGPGIRQDLTYKQWLTGSIPVVPVTEPVLGATYKTDYAHPREVVLEVALSTKKGTKDDQTTKVFYITLRRFGNGATGRWLVDSWIPYVPVGVPRNPN